MIDTNERLHEYREFLTRGGFVPPRRIPYYVR